MTRALLAGVALAVAGCDLIAGIHRPVHDPCLDDAAGDDCDGRAGGGGGAESGGGGAGAGGGDGDGGGGATTGTGGGPGCGNGVVDPGEQCDDGNDLPGDGCAACVVECAGPGAFVDPTTFHCYLFVTQPSSTWDAANRYCDEAGFHLAAVTSPAEIAAVEPHLAGKAWIGGRRDGSAFVWDDGETWSFAPWKDGEPPTDLTKACVEIESSAFLGEHCDAKVPFLCEREPAGT